MIFIAHRGNTSGSNPTKENNPLYLKRALENGFETEVDVWLLENSWWLGHDRPTYQIEISFFRNKRLWCHAKNVEALENMLKRPWINCFWHQNDDVVLTSKKYMWTFPGRPLTAKSIAVLPENKPSQDLSICFGICSDYVEKYKKRFQK